MGDGLLTDHIDPDLVAEGRALLTQEGNLNWRWGDLVARVMPPGQDDRGKLVQWAEEIGWLETGRTITTLLSFRTVALAWPKDLRCAEASFTAHAELAAMPNRFDLIEPGLSKRKARVLGGKKPEIGSKEQRGEVVAGLLGDPAVLRQLAENPEFAKALRRATISVEDAMADAVDRERSERSPGLHRADAAYTAFGDLRRARRAIVSAVGRFAEIDGLDGHRAEGLRLAQETKDAAVLALAFFEGQASTASLEAALASWTDGDA